MLRVILKVSSCPVVQNKTKNDPPPKKQQQKNNKPTHNNQPPPPPTQVKHHNLFSFQTYCESRRLSALHSVGSSTGSAEAPSGTILQIYDLVPKGVQMGVGFLTVNKICLKHFVLFLLCVCIHNWSVSQWKQ